MKYGEETEETLKQAKEKVSEAVEMLEEVLPDAAAELNWIRENIREELLAVRCAAEAVADEAWQAGGLY